MPASFVVGAKKIADEAEPRFVVITGAEAGLRSRLVDEVMSRDYETYWLSGESFQQFDVFTPSFRQSKTKLVYLAHGEAVGNWDWLPTWFNKVKGMKLVIETTDPACAALLEKRANTRGLVIDCTAPTGSAGQTKLAKLIASWYNESTSQVTLMLHKNNWRVTECLQLLDKLRVLSLPLTSETILQLGLVREPTEEFFSLLTDDDRSMALTVIPRLAKAELEPLIADLSRWLDRVTRVKLAHTFMKSVHELALEVGETKATTELLLKQSRRYEMGRLTKIALALTQADKSLTQGVRNGVLEALVCQW